MSREPGETTDDFREAVEEEPAVELEAGEAEREFNYAARGIEAAANEPEPRYANEPVPDEPTLGAGAASETSIEEQRASRFEEMQERLSRVFDEARRDRAKGEPDLGR